HVISERLWKAVMYARSGSEIDVAAAARDDDISAHLEKLEERMHAGDCDDARRLVDLFLGQIRETAQPDERFAALELLLKIVLRYLGIEIADLEPWNPVLARELSDDRNEFIDATVASRVPGGADHERYAFPARLREKKRELSSHEVAQGRVFTEIDRAGIGAAAISDDVVGVRCHPESKTLGARGRRSEVSTRGAQLPSRFCAW